MVARQLATNFRKPTGILGRLVGRMMAQSNAAEAAWTVALLDIQPNDRVLEVGFGPGRAIEHAARKVESGLVAGIDYSETMVKAAAKRNAAAVRAGRVELRRGDVAALPYPDGTFDRAYAIHCLYFWPQPKQGLKELQRVLKPGGVLAVTILPKDKWPKERTPPADVFTLYGGSEVAQMLLEAGFANVRVENYPEPDRFPGLSVLGSR